MPTQLTDTSHDKCPICNEVIVKGDEVILAGHCKAQTLGEVLSDYDTIDDGKLHGNVRDYKLFHYDCLADFDINNRA